MDISIIIVNYKAKLKLEKNLQALLASQTHKSFEVFVVDNNSQDGSVEMMIKDFKQINLIINNTNLGFAKANNQALKLAQGRYLLLLNPDMQVEPETIEKLVDWLDVNPQAAVAGIKLIDEKNNIIKHVRNFPKFYDQLLITTKLAHFFPHTLDNYLQACFNYEKAAKVDSIRGSFFVIRRSTYQTLGGLDERFFIWFEETDYCKKVEGTGLQVWYTPVTVCHDFVGQSFKLLPSKLTQKYFKDSMIKYFVKWHPIWQALALSLAWILSDAMYSIARIIKIKPKIKT